MAFWQSVQQKTGLTINANERVEKIESQAGGFLTTTSQGTYRSRAILLAIGRRGTPRPAIGPTRPDTGRVSRREME